MSVALLSLLLFTQAAPSPSLEPQLLRVENRFAVIEPYESGSRQILQGERVLDVPLRWRQGATLSAAVERQYGKRRYRAEAGQVLARTLVAFRQEGFVGALTFCRPRAVYEGNALSAMVWRGTTDGQYCLIDRDGDGSLDHDMLLNTGDPAERLPQPISPVAYTVEDGAKAGAGDRLTVYYSGGANFSLGIEQSGRSTVFAFFRYKDERGQHAFASLIKGKKQPEGSFLIELPGRTLILTAVDKAARTATISWKAESETRVIPIPDEVL